MPQCIGLCAGTSSSYPCYITSQGTNPGITGRCTEECARSPTTSPTNSPTNPTKLVVIPIAISAFLCVCLAGFCAARRRRRRDPNKGTNEGEEEEHGIEFRTNPLQTREAAAPSGTGGSVQDTSPLPVATPAPARLPEQEAAPTTALDLPSAAPVDGDDELPSADMVTPRTAEVVAEMERTGSGRVPLVPPETPPAADEEDTTSSAASGDGGDEGDESAAMPRPPEPEHAPVPWPGLPARAPATGGVAPSPAGAPRPPPPPAGGTSPPGRSTAVSAVRRHMQRASRQRQDNDDSDDTTSGTLGDVELAIV